MKNNLTILVIILLSVAVLWQIIDVRRTYTPAAPTLTPTPTTVARGTVYTLHDVHASGEHGTVEIKEIAGQAVLLLTVEGAPDEIVQPTTLYEGTCSAIGRVVTDMTVPDAGESETDLSMGLAQLKAKYPLAVVIYSSTNRSTVPVACADIH